MPDLRCQHRSNSPTLAQVSVIDADFHPWDGQNQSGGKRCFCDVDRMMWRCGQTLPRIHENDEWLLSLSSSSGTNMRACDVVVA